MNSCTALYTPSAAADLLPSTRLVANDMGIVARLSHKTHRAPRTARAAVLRPSAEEASPGVLKV